MPDRDEYVKKLNTPLRSAARDIFFALGWAGACVLCALISHFSSLADKYNVFLPFTLCQLVSLAEHRSERSVFDSGKNLNNMLVFVFASVLSFCTACVFVSPLSDVLELSSRGWHTLLMTLAPAAVLFAAFEIYKLIKNKPAKNNSTEQTEEFFLPREKKKRRLFRSKTEEYIVSGFAGGITAGGTETVIANQAEDKHPDFDFIPEEKGSLSSEMQAQLVRLSVQCALTDINPAGYETLEQYDIVTDTLCSSVTQQSGEEEIAEILAAAFIATGESVDYSICLDCARAIKENMKL